MEPNIPSNLRTEIEYAINRNSAENGSNTPDFILADFLLRCLEAFDVAGRARDSWYGIAPRPGAATAATASGLVDVRLPSFEDAQGEPDAPEGGARASAEGSEEKL